jgi:hypothetical protein
MFGQRRPIERYSDADLFRAWITGTVVCLLVLIPACFIRVQPEWPLWVVRAYGGVWLLDWWRRHAGEWLRRRG